MLLSDVQCTEASCCLKMFKKNRSETSCTFEGVPWREPFGQHDVEAMAQFESFFGSHVLHDDFGDEFHLGSSRSQPPPFYAEAPG